MKEIVIVCLIGIVASLAIAATRIALPQMAKAIVDREVEQQKQEMQRVLANE